MWLIELLLKIDWWFYRRGILKNESKRQLEYLRELAAEQESNKLTSSLGEQTNVKWDMFI